MISGEKVFLTAIERSSLEQFRQWRNQSNLRKYFREYREISKHMQSKWFKNRVLNNPNQVDFEIHDISSEKLIGHCSLNYIDWRNRHAEFGIYVGDSDFRGGGYGKEALKLLLDYGFKTLNLNKIWCEVYSNNNAIGLYRHLGFVDEGVMRQHHYDDGQWLDSYFLSILRTEYNDME